MRVPSHLRAVFLTSPLLPQSWPGSFSLDFHQTIWLGICYKVLWRVHREVSGVAILALEVSRLLLHPLKSPGNGFFVSLENINPAPSACPARFYSREIEDSALGQL